tara:strand:- start:632 stop:931 length:300 start_codon:yes stop_codon:yes gene_type:complete
MSLVDSSNTLLREQLGKGKVDIFTTDDMSTKDYYCVYFPVASVISSITVGNASGAADTNPNKLHTTVPAGTTLFMRITGITLSSGIGIGYMESDERTGQ